MSLSKVLYNIENARIKFSNKHTVKLVIASKYVGSSEILELYKNGQRAFGENRVQDMKTKVSNLIDIPLEWHYIGSLQSNKINNLLSLSPFMIQSIDSIDIALEIDKRVNNNNIFALLQINSSYESQKNGINTDNAIEEFIRIQESCKYLKIVGVMSMGPTEDDYNTTKKSFEETYNIFDKLKKYGAKYCSMGMSRDYELAIECGSNMVRVGSAIFE
jgi:hypothetical protein